MDISEIRCCLIINWEQTLSFHGSQEVVVANLNKCTDVIGKACKWQNLALSEKSCLLKLSRIVIK